MNNLQAELAQRLVGAFINQVSPQGAIIYQLARHLALSSNLPEPIREAAVSVQSLTVGFAIAKSLSQPKRRRQRTPKKNR